MIRWTHIAAKVCPEITSGKYDIRDSRSRACHECNVPIKAGPNVVSTLNDGKDSADIDMLCEGTGIVQQILLGLPCGTP